MHTTTEKVLIDKKLLENFLKHLNNIVVDLEQIEEEMLMNKAMERLEELKKGEVKGLTEKDFEEFLKKMS